MSAWSNDLDVFREWPAIRCLKYTIFKSFRLLVNAQVKEGSFDMIGIGYQASLLDSKSLFIQYWQNSALTIHLYRRR